jgi:hypothetical protein
VVIAVAIMAYWPSLDAGLVSDDFQFTRRPWGLNFLTHLTSGWEHKLGRATAYRPFTVFTYGLNQWLWSSPTGFHAVNILIHATASAFATLLARRLGLGRPAAAVCGLLFALHPVHSEAVSWISGRTAALAGALSLGSMWLTTYRGRGPLPHAAAATLAALAILSYEGSFLLPAMLLAVAWHARPADPPRPWRSLAVTAVPLVALWLCYLSMRWFVISGLEHDSWALSSAVSREGFAAPVSQRAWQNTMQFVTRILAGGWNLQPWQSRTFLLSAAAALAAVMLAVRHAANSRRLVVLASILGLLAFAPYVTYTGYADRFAYLAAIGICLVLSAGVQVVVERGRRVEQAGAVLVATALLGLWVRQLVMSERDWREAGEVAAQITSQAAAIAPPLPPGAHLHVVGVPLNIRSAYVFITYFDLAMSQALARSDVTISMDPNPAGPCPVRNSAPSLCLRWNSNHRVLSVAQRVS